MRRPVIGRLVVLFGECGWTGDAELADAFDPPNATPSALREVVPVVVEVEVAVPRSMPAGW